MANGLLRVVSPDALAAAERRDAERRRAAEAAALPDQFSSALAAHIRRRWEAFRRHRDSSAGWSDRMLAALRVFRGEYSPRQLAEIERFGGSTVYARITAAKCRAATALLRDLYLGPDRPWGIEPTPEPNIPSHAAEAIQELVQAEAMALVAQGVPLDADALRTRTLQLAEAARNAARKQARLRAKDVERAVEDILVEGGFYEALAQFLVDLPLFPFACVKGPVARVVDAVKWGNGGVPVMAKQPKLFWHRVSPFDVWFTPGVSDIAHAEVVERVRYTRADLVELMDLPGFDANAVRAALDDYASGHVETMDASEHTRATLEHRESPVTNESGLIDGLEFHGSVPARLVLDWIASAGSSDEVLSDLADEVEAYGSERDVSVQAWLIGRHVIKVQLEPSPRKRHPYFITSYEKVPGTPVGNALPDILSDIQDVCNATLRALVNNQAMSSGPQVVVDRDQLLPTDDITTLYPWKVWSVSGDGLGVRAPPVSFFQPASNAQELLVVYEKFTQIADEISAIPRYVTGSERLGGAGRTASGLAMLMGNASKVLQSVAANIDRDVIGPLLRHLFDIVLFSSVTLPHGVLLQGDEEIRVKGVLVAVQRETLRQRQLEFLQITSNPLDAQILGVPGRAKLLSEVAATLGLDGEEIVPDPETLAQQQQQQGVAPPQAQAGPALSPSPVIGVDENASAFGQAPRTALLQNSGG